MLFCCDEPCSADVAMVFGAANELDLARRTKRGVELYRSGFVPRLLVTGGGVLACTRPEAKRMAEIARSWAFPTLICWWRTVREHVGKHQFLRGGVGQSGAA